MIYTYNFQPVLFPVELLIVVGRKVTMVMSNLLQGDSHDLEESVGVFEEHLQLKMNTHIKTREKFRNN